MLFEHSAWTEFDLGRKKIIKKAGFMVTSLNRRTSGSQTRVKFSASDEISIEYPIIPCYLSILLGQNLIWVEKKIIKKVDFMVTSLNRRTSGSQTRVKFSASDEISI